ncbi:hypothetical protein FZO89_04475 [Luteimonas viscosa]|uniref:Meckel syndrome type 1 protein n=1 Tax=Luteimonas viscosa TaxID=1132694 RepID=A0A5D4XN78_9GAMM|nr:hypothetical protein [Luteimonas viscosa]TYT25574.1 hypothetical protein FZO89_04475 [Luteimonas viscosa]
MSRRDHEPLTPEERELAARLSRLDPHAAPPAALDAAILAAARAQPHGEGAPATRAQRRPRRPRWPVGLGIAASLAVAVGVAWQLRPLPESRALSAPSELEMPQAVIAEPAPAGAAITPPEATGEAEDTPAAENGGATVAADEARAPSGPEGSAPSRSPPAVARDQHEIAVAADRAATDAAARQDARRKAEVEAEAGRAEASARRAAAQPAAALAEDADAMDIVFDQATPPPPPPPPPPAPPAPPAPAADDTGFVPAPPAPQSASRPEEDEDASHARRRRPDPDPAAEPSEAAAEAAAIDQIIVTGTRIEPAPATLDALADQPLDDRPPASADSPAVRTSWLQRIRELRDAGQMDEARASLREFVRRHPEAEVPDDLRPLLGE